MVLHVMPLAGLRGIKILKGRRKPWEYKESR